MDRIARELVTVAKMLVAKARPETLFEQMFFDLRMEMKAVNDKKAHAIAGKLTKALKEAFGNKIVSAEAKLGQFRGHHYITSAPVVVKATDKQASQIEGVLKAKFSPKFHLKGVEDGVATFNVR